MNKKPHQGGKHTILSSKIPLGMANTNKKILLREFIHQYREAVKFYIDYNWEYHQLDKQNFQAELKFSAKSRPEITDLSDLSARALKCAATQAVGMIKSCIKKLKQQQYVLKNNELTESNRRRLQSLYDKGLYKLVKPHHRNVFPELNSICCSLERNDNIKATRVLVLKCLGKRFGKIAIPINFHRHTNNLAQMGREMTSFLITPSHMHIRYEIVVAQKQRGVVVGADQGIKTCVTLSDQQITKPCPHGHDLDSIVQKLARKKKGSKAFKRAQRHRTNYINWSINQLDLTNIKQINLEKIDQIGKGKRNSRYLQGFAHGEIRKAMNKVCDLTGVQIKEQSSAYRSQRCSSCGFVHTSNRRGKVFECRSCSHKMDSDLNAATNHQQVLRDIPYPCSHLPNRTTGFFWEQRRVYGVDGRALTVPVAKKRK